MKNRLIELIMNVPMLTTKFVGRSQGRRYLTAGHLADHLLANGVIVPPCKVGQTVYIVEKSISQVFVGKVYEIFSNEFGTVCRSSRKGYFSFSFTADAIGKTVFLSREEAERAVTDINVGGK